MSVEGSVHSTLVPNGPRVVALGGGYGLSTTLRAARKYAGSITGVVSVADDGGSSGRLRKAFGIPAPGDLRRCLVALADDDSVWGEAFEHRFAAAELDGHPLGNIVLAGLTQTMGSFGDAIDECLRMLGSVGRVVPATSEPVMLKATFRRDGGTADHVISIEGTVEGEVRVGSTVGVNGVSVVPADPQVPAEAISAILEADQLCIGPGSLFTSILAVLAVPKIREAVQKSRAQRVFISNLGEQHPETTGFDLAAHLDALHQHGVDFDVVIYDDTNMPVGNLSRDVPLISARLGNASGKLHDPNLLAVALESVFSRGI